jgi:hypothetical protein
MTHRPTIERASKIYADTFGCVIKIHDIRPSDSVRHKPAYYFAIRRTIWLSRISEALIPYSTTKFNHWRLLHELCEERAARCGRTISGGLFRGGIASKRAPYTEREHALVLALREANAYANNRSRTRMEASAA